MIQLKMHIVKYAKASDSNTDFTSTQLWIYFTTTATCYGVFILNKIQYQLKKKEKGNCHVHNGQ